MVARGNEQKKGIDFDEVFAPVARYEIIRTVLAGAVENKMHVHHVDVASAYVQGKLTDTIYIQQPEMFVEPGKEEKICKLNKPLYGLKQAGRNWYQTLDKYLTTIGLERSPINPCVYVSNTDTNLILLIYVDDILIAAKNLEKLEKVKRLIRKKFKINDLGNVTNVLGIHVERDGNIGNIKLSQRKYIEETLEKFGMKDCKPAYTPLVRVKNSIKK